MRSHAVARPRVRVRMLATAPALLGLGCAGASPATSTPPITAPAGELAAATPAIGGGAASNEATTGTYARVVLGSQRERVTELFRSFLRGLMARDVDAVRSLFDSAPMNVDTGQVGDLDDVQRLYALIIAEDEVGQLAALLEHADAHVYSQRAWSLAHNAVPASMGPEDWWIEIGPGDLPTGSFPRSLPSMLVRIVGDGPRIVGVHVRR